MAAESLQVYATTQLLAMSPNIDASTESAQNSYSKDSRTIIEDTKSEKNKSNPTPKKKVVNHRKTVNGKMNKLQVAYYKSLEPVFEEDARNLTRKERREMAKKIALESTSLRQKDEQEAVDQGTIIQAESKDTLTSEICEDQEGIAGITLSNTSYFFRVLY